MSSYTLYVYKADRRYRRGERAVLTRVCASLDDVHKMVQEGFYSAKGYRYEYHPTMITVQNLMTGKDVEIVRDTPWCCNPASETYWSM